MEQGSLFDGKEDNANHRHIEQLEQRRQSKPGDTLFNLDRDLTQTEEPELPDNATINDRFEAFHKENPVVYMAIVSLARELKRQNFQSIGMKMIFEQLRWRHALKTEGREKYKLNNNYTAHYARLVMQQEPDLAGFFETRDLKSTKY